MIVNQSCKSKRSLLLTPNSEQYDNDVCINSGHKICETIDLNNCKDVVFEPLIDHVPLTAFIIVLFIHE